MSRQATVSAVAAFFVLILAGLLTQGDSRLLTPTSFGAIPAGYRALYELLQESGLPVARSFAPPERLAPGRTIWWLEPKELAAADGAQAEAEPAAAPLGRPAHPLRGSALARWIEAGGTAVIAFPGAPGAATRLAERDVPARAPESLVLDEEQASLEALPVDGPLARGLRMLELPAPVVFLDPDPKAWRTVAHLGGKPFVLESALGRGRLVVASDARFLSNAWLDRADAAPFAIDLVRAYGVPWIDEHEHGFAASQGALAYLAGSPALPFFAGLALLALAFAWFGAAWPARRGEDFDPSAPTLETFVASLARLYAATQDHARVLDRYRELTARRLRRALGLPPDAPLAQLSERLARRPRVPREALALLAGPTGVRDEAELRRAVAALDGLLMEVTQ
jgi:hypothetical protein